MVEKRKCQDDIPVLGVTVGDFWSWALLVTVSCPRLLWSTMAVLGKAGTE